MKYISRSDRAYLKQLDEWMTLAQDQVKSAAENASRVNMASSFFFEHLKKKYGLAEEDNVLPSGKIEKAGVKPDGNSD